MRGASRRCACRGDPLARSPAPNSRPSTGCAETVVPWSTRSQSTPAGCRPTVGPVRKRGDERAARRRRAVGTASGGARRVPRRRLARAAPEKNSGRGQQEACATARTERRESLFHRLVQLGPSKARAAGRAHEVARRLSISPRLLDIMYRATRARCWPRLDPAEMLGQRCRARAAGLRE